MGSAPTIVSVTSNKANNAVNEGDPFDITVVWADTDQEDLEFDFKVKNTTSGLEGTAHFVMHVTDPSEVTFTQTAGSPHTLTIVGTAANSVTFRCAAA